MTSREVLNAISSFDPDGMDYGEAGPTNNDYLNFEAAVIAEYGRQALDDYYGRRFYKESGTYE